MGYGISEAERLVPEKELGRLQSIPIHVLGLKKAGLRKNLTIHTTVCYAEETYP
jgi:hypothetical protein